MQEVIQVWQSKPTFTVCTGQLLQTLQFSRAKYFTLQCLTLTTTVPDLGHYSVWPQPLQHLTLATTVSDLGHYSASPWPLQCLTLATTVPHLGQLKQLASRPDRALCQFVMCHLVKEAGHIQGQHDAKFLCRSTTGYCQLQEQPLWANTATDACNIRRGRIQQHSGEHVALKHSSAWAGNISQWIKMAKCPYQWKVETALVVDPVVTP